MEKSCKKNKKIRKDYAVFEDFAEKLTFKPSFQKNMKRSPVFWKAKFRGLRVELVFFENPNSPPSLGHSLSLHGQPPPGASFILQPSDFRHLLPQP